MSVIVEGTTLTCPKHPKYKAKRRPKTNFFWEPGYCRMCWEIWGMAVDSGDLRRELRDLKRCVRDYAEGEQ